MGIKKVNFEIITSDFIKEINKQFKIQGNPTILGITIDIKGKVKTLKYYTANTETGNRTILFEKEYHVKNPADFVRQDINYVLYRELFFNCFAFYGVNMESIINQRAAEKAVDNLKPKEEHPVTPEEAFEKTLKDS